MKLAKNYSKPITRGNRIKHFVQHNNDDIRTCQEIEKVIHDMKNGKCSGIDDVPAEIINRDKEKKNHTVAHDNREPERKAGGLDGNNQTFKEVISH